MERYKREQHTILVVQMDPVLAPVLAVRDELEVPPGQRMEPVRHPHTPELVGSGLPTLPNT